MAPFFRFASAAAFLLATAVSPAWAQATAQLNGRVTDESGAVLPGVTVTATQTDTGFTRSVVTDGTGAWIMPNLPTGPYRLEVSLQGFRTYVQTGIVLQVGRHADDQRASSRSAISRRRCRSKPPRRSSTCGAPASATVVEQERIVELPLQGRQVTDLIVLAGAAVQTGRPRSKRLQRAASASRSPAACRFGVAYLLDGAMHNNPQNNGGLPLPFPDALQEFRVATSGLSAQNGMHAGASVNAVTKSGTNSVARQRLRVPARQAVQRHRVRLRRSVRTANAWTTGCGATSTAARSADRSSGTGCSSSAATRARSSRVRRRPTTSPTCRRRRCWRATSRRSPRRRATAAGRSRCARRSSTTGSIRRSSAPRR